MGRAKEMLDEGMTLERYLKDILENIDDSKVQGIAKLAIDKGFDNLSDKQKHVLKDGITDYIMEECPNCGEHISYEDMEISILNGMCSSCQHDCDKNYVD
ncbi:MAG: hypothetical protein U9Q30_00080 [Campylobacterota bacterium]|nr:hypothetical protein [Campylobacterota bacterium]